MTQAVEGDVVPDPMTVGVFGAMTEMPHPAGNSNLIHQLGSARREWHNAAQERGVCHAETGEIPYAEAMELSFCSDQALRE